MITCRTCGAPIKFIDYNGKKHPINISEPKKVYLGSFRNKKDAHLAYKNAALKYFGEFARY